MSMKLIGWLCLSLVGAAFLRFDDGALAAQTTNAISWSAFDALVADAKKSMMADPKAALQIARSAAAIAQGRATSARQIEALAISLWLEGEALTRVNRVPEARAAIERAIILANSYGKITKLDGDLSLSLARVADAGGDVGLALKNFQRGHDIFAQLGDARNQSIALQGLGSIYDEAHDFAREVRYYRLASQTYSEDPALELSAANNIGFALQQLGNYDGSITDFRRALAISKSLKSSFLEARILTNLAAVYAKRHGFVDADKAANDALRLLGKADENGWAPFVWGVKAEIEYERGALDAAAIDLERAFRDVNIATTISPYRDIHQIAYRVYRANGNLAAALAHLEAFKRLDDQGRSLSASANLALMGAQFDYANQQLEIEHLKSEQLKRDLSLRESRAATQKLIFAMALLAGLLLIAWISWRHHLVRLHRNTITRVNIALTTTLAERDDEIARRIETETHLRDAIETAKRANLSKSHFLANMSHELRTPLNAIIGFSEIIAQGSLGAVSPPKYKDYAADINASGGHLLAILNDILDMARIDAGKETLVESDLCLNAILEDALRLLGNKDRTDGKTIRVANLPQEILVRGDERRLRQVVVNLISNSVKFTGTEGLIEASIESVEDGVDLVVRDNGIGIPADKLAVVMEPFGQADGPYARSHGGIGLGLPIVKSLVELHGGRLTIASVPNEGTTVRVHLPSERILPLSRRDARAATTA